MADYEYISSTGVIVPDTSDLKSDVEQEWKDSFGQDLIVTADTPQGVMIAQEVSSRASVVRNNAMLANQINPNINGGVFLDAVCAFTGLERRKATRTLVPGVVLTGIPETPIDAGVRGKSQNGDLFESVGAVVLNAEGTATVDFQSVEFGPVPCPIDTLDTVVDTVLGWEGIANPLVAKPGETAESDASLRERRNLTLARQGISLVEAQISGLYDLPGVRSLQYRENFTDTDQTIDGIFMLKHSVWACVDGGTDQEIAKSLLTNKSDGANWNGIVVIPIIEEYSGQTYPVKFDRPKYRPIIVQITVRMGTNITDPQITVRDAIMAYYNGEIPGERGLVVGENVSPYELGAAVNYFQPGMFVAKVEVAFIGSEYQTDELVIALNEKATITSGSITVIVQ